MSVRDVTAADRDALARICRLTGFRGQDATGRYGDDSVLADVYATPYLHGPGGFCLVWDEGSGPLGYVLGTDDTRAFQHWFTNTWWPSVSHPAITTADAELHRGARDPARMLIEAVDDYPAHLHIDLLPEVQGRGIGRLLIEAMAALLRARGVPAVHLTAERANAGAQAFYPRVGFTEIGADAGSVTFGRRLAE